MTETIKATPGPWTWHGVELLSPAAFVMGAGKGSQPSDNDARLIAAAPDMLDALKAELADLQDDIRWADGGELERLMMRRDRLMAVLSKAEALI